MQNIIGTYNNRFGRRAESHIVSITSAFCPDSFFNKRGGETAKIKQIREGCQPLLSGVNPGTCRNAVFIVKNE